jgi:NADH-quinone oxidoreductase subunit G
MTEAREKVTINVDGVDYQVNAGDNLLEACLSLKQDVPYFCWHPSLGSVGSCRQCAVQIYRDADDDKGRMAMSCMTQVAEGMIVSLGAESTKKFREQNIEMMMSNHPHDCPVCEEGGECHLQDMTIQSGHTSRRHTGQKKTYENQNLGPCIGHEMNRCIACYRCVRFYDDYAGGDDLVVLGSRENVYFGRHEDGTLESPFSGNLAEVCPTGVFTDKTLSDSYTRKWDLQAAPSICGQCSLGCNITPAERDGRVKRITNRYHGQVNGYFICDRGRFGYTYSNSKERLDQCLVTTDKGAEATACNYLEALDYVSQIFDELGADNVLALGSPRASVEENFALQTLVGSDNFYAGITQTQQQMQCRIVEILSSGAVQSPSMKQMESADAVLILGEDLMQSAPRMALAVRQASRNEGFNQAASLGIAQWQDDSVRILTQDQRSPIISVNSTGSELDQICVHALQLNPQGVTEFAAEVSRLIKAGAADDSESASESATPEALAVAKLLLAAKRPLIISGTSSNQTALIDAAAELAVSLGKAQNQAPWLSYVLEASNSMGLSMLDGTTHISALQQRLEVAKNPTALVVMQQDLANLMDKDSAKKLADQCKHLIVIDQFASTTSEQADVVIAAASMMETEGTLVNNEGRSQRYFSVLASSNTTKIDNWRLMANLAVMINTKGNASEGISKLAECKVYDDLVDMLCALDGWFCDWDQVAPDADFRVAGMKIPRQSHRFSGRTSLYADEKVSENKQPVDDDSALSYSMEGSPINRPAALNPLVWMPGWNSNEAINKFQEEINGPLMGGDPGLLLFENQASVTPLNFEQSDTSTPQPGAGEVLAVAHARLFDGEALSARSSALRQRAARAVARIHPDTASQLNLASAQSVTVKLNGSSCSLPLIQDAEVAIGIVVLPAQADAAIKASQLPALVSISADSTAQTADIEGTAQ